MDVIAKGEITLVTTIGTITQEPIIYQSHCNSFQKSGFQVNDIDFGKVKNCHYDSFNIVNWALSNFCYCPINLGKLEQLECLCSENSPPPLPWLPILRIHIRSHVITRQSQTYKFHKIAKNSMWNGSSKYCGRYRADKVLSTDGRIDRRTDGRTAWNQYPPLQLRWSGGYNEHISANWIMISKMACCLHIC